MADEGTDKPVETEPPEMEWTVENVMWAFGATESQAREMIAFRNGETEGDLHEIDESDETP
jgi:hypothetical protein